MIRMQSVLGFYIDPVMVQWQLKNPSIVIDIFGGNLLGKKNVSPKGSFNSFV